MLMVQLEDDVEDNRFFWRLFLGNNFFIFLIFLFISELHNAKDMIIVALCV